MGQVFVPRAGWAHASEGGRWSWGQGFFLPTHWLAPSPRMALALHALLAGSRREAQEREQAARPPACKGCV